MLLGNEVTVKYLISQYGHKVISFIIIFAMLSNWEMFFSMRLPGLTLENYLLITVWVTLLLISAIGLYLHKNWGFLFFYPAILLTTIGFSISILPFVTSIFPMEMRPWVMIAINSFFLLVAIWLHRGKSKRPINKIV